MNTTIVSQQAPNIMVISPLQVFEARTADQQWFAGFNQYSDDVRTGDYCSAEELAAMTPQERKGYRDAMDAESYAETSAYLISTNAYGDRTEY